VRAEPAVGADALEVHWQSRKTLRARLNGIAFGGQTGGAVLKALYYPHTDITNPVILKNALLLWDSLETIVPRSGWLPQRVKNDRLVNEAVDLIVRPRVPSAPERTEAHHALQDIAKTGALSSLLAEAPPGLRRREFLIYPEKFLDQTWHMLQQGGMARWVAAESDYGVPAVVGFLMMSLLADACAGTQVQKVTDRVDAYAWLSEAHARALGSPHVTGLDVSQVAPAYDRLVTLSLEVLDARAIPLKRLVEFRKRESKRGGTDYSAMRRRYLQTLQAHIKRIGTEARSAADLRELERQFKEELKQDLADLKAELNTTSLKALFSKEVAVSALITAGSLVAPISGLTALASKIGLVGVIPLLKAVVDLRGARRTALQRHVSSWLYLAGQGKLQIR